MTWTAHLEITGGLLRVYAPGCSFEQRSPFVRALDLVGHEETAILKALQSDDKITRRQYEVALGCVARAGFKNATWNDYRNGNPEPIIRWHDLARFLP